MTNSEMKRHRKPKPVQLAQWAHSLPEQEDRFPPTDSPEEQHEIEAECSDDAAGAEATLAATATAASTSDLPACWTTRQVGEWKDRNP